MQIIIWGTRGSIPTPEIDKLKYGGNTTCVEIRLNNGNLIVIDAGSGIRNLGKYILQENKYKEIFKDILKSENEEARQKTIDYINHLLKLNYHTFKDLLRL